MVQVLVLNVSNKTVLHIWEDAYIPEIIDPVSGKHVDDGEIGELVMTSFRAGKVCPSCVIEHGILHASFLETANVGVKHRRMDRILGRADDMFIVKRR